jgi:hypothetical protein
VFIPFPYSARGGQRGWAKYRDSENFKGLAALNHGAKIAPVPLPELFPFPARGGPLRTDRNDLGVFIKNAVTGDINTRLDLKNHAPGLKRCDFSLVNGSRVERGQLGISVPLFQGGPPGYFIHISITTPIVSALKNYYR